ncbi:MAG: riboflavin synthase [Candidatus Omnitrophica bacterium]|nr:riboflavin synthase [Candidatus Omnitrophota bacterium]
MFTGIVETVSTVKALSKKQNLFTLAVEKPKAFTDIKIGDSIANDGACLTVTAIKGGCFYFDLMKETLDATTLKHLTPGKKVNLERAMKAEARIGGHFVTGHVDAVGVIKDIRTLPNYVEYRISVPKPLMCYVVPKGSITLDGISLTVGEVTKTWCAVYFIPHTLEVTTIGLKKVGDEVNIETDLLAKYILKSKG